MNNHYKLFLFLIVIVHILFGCAHPSMVSSSDNKTSTVENNTQNDNSNQNSSKKPEAISQDIVTYQYNTAKITLSSKSFDSVRVKYIITQLPKNGILRGSAQHYIYTPYSGFIGKDSFLFRISQNTYEKGKWVKKESDSAVIMISVVTYDHAPLAKAEASGVNSLKISWSPIQGATSYKIYRENLSGGDFKTVLKDEIVDPSFTDSGLTPTTEYHYQVSAMWNWKESKKSKTVSALTSQPLFEPVSYNFDGGLPKHWSADEKWKAKSPRTGNSSIGFEGVNSGSTSMMTNSFQVPSYGANISFWHRFKKPINYNFEWSYDGEKSWHSLHQKSFDGKKIVTETLKRTLHCDYGPINTYVSYLCTYKRNTEKKKYDIPQGTKQIKIKVSGIYDCWENPIFSKNRKIYVNGYSYSFGKNTIPSNRWENNQLKIYIYEYCPTKSNSYDLEIQFIENTGLSPISDWEKISIQFNPTQDKTAWFRFEATNTEPNSKWHIDDLMITPITPSPVIDTPLFPQQ